MSATVDLPTDLDVSAFSITVSETATPTASPCSAHDSIFAPSRVRSSLATWRAVRRQTYPPQVRP